MGNVTANDASRDRAPRCLTALPPPDSSGTPKLPVPCRRPTPQTPPVAEPNEPRLPGRDENPPAEAQRDVPLVAQGVHAYAQERRESPEHLGPAPVLKE